MRCSHNQLTQHSGSKPQLRDHPKTISGHPLKPRTLRILLITIALTVQLVSVCLVTLSGRESASDQMFYHARENLGRLSAHVIEQAHGYLLQAGIALQFGTKLINDGTLDGQFCVRGSRWRWFSGKTFATCFRSTANHAYQVQH